MRVVVLCVVIQVFTAALDIDQSQYPNDENQIRRFKFNRYLPLIPKTIKHDQSRRYNGLSIGMLHPQQSNAFKHFSRPIVTYLMGRASNIYKNEGLRRIPFIIERRINTMGFRKYPKMLIQYFYPKIIVYRFLPKELFYKLQKKSVNLIHEIKNRNLKLLKGKRNDIFRKTNKKQEPELIRLENKFSIDITKEPGSNQEGLPLNVLENENKNKQIQNIAKSESVKNIGVSGQNNQDNSKIVIKNLHVNVGANVSHIANKTIKESDKTNATTNVTLIKPSNKIIYSTNHSIGVNNTGKLLTDHKSLNKIEANGTTKLWNQSDNSTFSAKNNTTQNNNDTYNFNDGNGKTLDYGVPNDRYMNVKQDIVTKKYSEFLSKGPEQDNSNKYNIRNTLGYHNFDQIRQVTGDMKKTEYNNESTNKKQAQENKRKKIQNKEYHMGKITRVENDTRHLENSLNTDNLNIKDTVTQTLLPKHTIDQNNRKRYGKVLEFEIEDLSDSENERREYSQETIGLEKYNKNEDSSSTAKTWKLHSDKESYQKNVHTKDNREGEESLEIENINESNLHKLDNLQGTEGNFLINAMKPIEITKAHRVIVKETKTITYGNQPQFDLKKYFTYNNKKPYLSQENVYELFLLNVNDNPLKNVIERDYETSDQIKVKENNVKSNLMYVILNCIALSNNGKCKNDKRGINNHNISFKTVKDLSDLSHGKESTLVFEKDYSHNKDAKQYEAKNDCSDCIQNDSTQKIQNFDGLLNTGYSTIINDNINLVGKNIPNKIQSWNENASVTSYRNNNYRNDEALTGYRDIKKKSIHVVKRRDTIGEQENTEIKSKVMTNKDKVIANILAPEDVKSDKKSLPYWLPSDAQEIYEILQQPSKEEFINDSLDLEMPLKEEIDKIVQLKKELGNENLEEIVTLKINTVGIGKATNINDKLVPSLYDVYLKNFITKILYRLRQKLLFYELEQQKNEIKNLDIHEIRKANTVLSIFETVRAVFNQHDDETLYELLVSLLRFHKNSEEDFDDEVKVILDSVSRKNIYGVLKHFLVPEPTLEAFRDYLKQLELYPQFVYFKVLEDILPNIKIIIMNALAMIGDKHDDINKNADTMDKLVNILITLHKVMRDLGIPETTQRFIIEQSILDIVRILANAYIRNYEKTVYVQVKKQLQDALYSNLNV